ncbi:SMI1/KNR4 family protein [Dactylosporangium sp. CA-152071]|uniref:SMI1/KNR4 family protein n=1 Tax=Dactylosporangium sp. CA-152071 TaxID=3239933 RepID=UPI003D8C8C84
MTEDEIFDAIRARVEAGRPTDSPPASLLPPPVSEQVIRDAEAVIGYRLPPLLRRIYRELGDGGIGPHGGIQGLANSWSNIPMVDGYLELVSAEAEPGEHPPPPRGVVFFCDLGCAMWALLDCRHPQGQMWWSDEYESCKLHLTLPEWFGAWLAGDSHDVWARPGLRLGPESWDREQAEATERHRIILHPDQVPLW